MAIYLDEQTRPLIEKLVKDRQDSHPKDFIADRLAKALEADRDRLKALAICEHSPAFYLGKKACCAKCNSFYKPGQGESWELQQEPLID